jgi:RNA polymerase sigma-70 factor (ECF subfamily)
MSAETSDERLVAQAQAGDREAFFTLYNRYLKRVYNRVRSRVPVDHAEDVTQEVFIAVLRSLNRFEGHSAFSTWLYTIVNRKIADFYRQYYRSGERQTISLDSQEESPLAAEERDLDEMVVIQQALHTLPENYQEVILLRFADGLGFAEIAAQTGKSLEATKSLYRRAIQALVEGVEKGEQP